ncbi:hypothetical protein, partial [Microvirga flavescens]|uniref:hypothetical protein n=1 Tax=Microvirga flavescens TaxID=2249811 RepID=UPI001300B2DC
NGAAVNPFVGVTLADGQNDDITVTLSFADAEGILGGLSGTGVTLVSNSVLSGARTVTVRGKASDLQTFFDNVTFDPTDSTANSGTFTTQFSFTVKDASHTASTHNNVVNVVTTIKDKTLPNTAPTFSIAGATSFAADDNGAAVNPFGGVTLGDNENDDLTVTLSFANIEGALGNLTGAGVQVTDNGTLSGAHTFTFAGKASALQTFFDNLTFNPTDSAANSGTFTTQFSFTVKDASHTASTHNNVVNVVTTIKDKTLPNTAPTFSITGATSFAADDNGAAVKPFAGVTLGDAENDELTVTLSFTDIEGALGGLSGAGVTLVSDSVLSGARMVTVRGKAVDLQNLFDNVTFDPTDSTANSGTFTTQFSFTVKDASHTASIHNNVVNVVTTIKDKTLPNTAPTFSIAGATSFAADDNGAAVKPFAGVTLGDAENDELTVTLSFADIEGALGGLSGAGVTLVSDSVLSGARTVTVRGKAVDLQNFFDNVTFDPTDSTQNSGTFTTQFSFTVKDASHTASTHNNVVNVVTTIKDKTPANTAPTLLVEAAKATTAATDTGAPVLAFEGVTFGDAENDDLTVTIGFADAEGDLVLPTTLPAGITSSEKVEFGTKTYTFIGKKDALNVFLQSVVKFDPKDQPGATSQTVVTTTFQIGVKDASHANPVTNNTVKVNTTVLDKTVPNSAPVIAGAATPVTKTIADTATVNPFADVTITDTEKDELTVTVTFDKAKGTLTDKDGNVFTSGTYTIVGSETEVTAALKGLVFNPTDRPTAAVGSTETTDFTITV